MAKSDDKAVKPVDEVLTMSRCRRLIEKHDMAARKRIANWLLAITGDAVPIDAVRPPPPPDARQQAMFE